jgi:hypothetical protein
LAERDDRRGLRAIVIAFDIVSETHFRRVNLEYESDVEIFAEIAFPGIGCFEKCIPGI